MDIRQFTTEQMVVLLQRYLSQNGFGSIGVGIQDFKWWNSYETTTIKKGIMEIPDGFSNEWKKANTLEIFGRRQRADNDKGNITYDDISPTICTYVKHHDVSTLIETYYLRTANDMDKALKEILTATPPPQVTPQTTQNSGHQDITFILNRILSLVERIDENTRPATFLPSRVGM